MKTFYFTLPTTGYESVVIEAESLDDAVEAIAQGNYDSDKSEYCTEDWDTPFRCNLQEWIKDHCDNTGE